MSTAVGVGEGVDVDVAVPVLVGRGVEDGPGVNARAVVNAVGLAGPAFGLGSAWRAAGEQATTDIMQASIVPQMLILTGSSSIT